MIGFLTLSYNSIHEFPILWYSWSLSWKGLPFRRSLPVSAIIFHIESDHPPPPTPFLPTTLSENRFLIWVLIQRLKSTTRLKRVSLLLQQSLKKKNNNNNNNNDQITHTRKTGINHKYQDSNFSVFRPATFLSMFYSTATRRCKQEEGQL